MCWRGRWRTSALCLDMRACWATRLLHITRNLRLPCTRRCILRPYLFNKTCTEQHYHRIYCI